MDQALVGHQLKFARFARKLLALLLVCSVIANAALSIHISRQTNQVVLVPSRVSDWMVARGAVDVQYLEQLAKDTASSLYQLTPTKLGEGRTVIEGVNFGEARSTVLSRFDKIANLIDLAKAAKINIKHLESHKPVLDVPDYPLSNSVSREEMCATPAAFQRVDTAPLAAWPRRATAEGARCADIPVKPPMILCARHALLLSRPNDMPGNPTPKTNQQRSARLAVRSCEACLPLHVVLRPTHLEAYP